MSSTVAKETVASRLVEPYGALFLLGDGLREDAGLLASGRKAQLQILGSLRNREHGKTKVVS
jgi:hypothetical protein